MHSFRVALILLGLATPWVSSSAGTTGAAVYVQQCAVCHGASAQGNVALQAPALAAQEAGYLARQLRHFRAGIRGEHPEDEAGAQMRNMARGLSDEDITAVADYLAALPVPSVEPLTGANLKNGSNYYQANCGACHGPDARGNPALNAPALAWLDEAYLKRQFDNFRRGIRGAHPEDTYGRQMKMMSTTLPDEQSLTDVIAFMHSRAPQK